MALLSKSPMGFAFKISQGCPPMRGWNSSAAVLQPQGAKISVQLGTRGFHATPPQLHPHDYLSRVCLRNGISVTQQVTGASSISPRSFSRYASTRRQKLQRHATAIGAHSYSGVRFYTKKHRHTEEDNEDNAPPPTPTKSLSERFLLDVYTILSKRFLLAVYTILSCCFYFLGTCLWFYVLLWPLDFLCQEAMHPIWLLPWAFFWTAVALMLFV